MKLDILNLKRVKAPDVFQNKSVDSIFWGLNDDTPLQIINTLNRSSTGKSCIETFSQYIYGNGFLDTQLSNSLCNDDESFDELLRKVSATFPIFCGFAILCKWITTVDGFKIRQASIVPFESLRLGIPNKKGVISYVMYNPFFGTQEYRIIDNEKYYLFDDDEEVIKAQIAECIQDNTEYKGQIFWVGLESAFNHFHPLPFWWGDNLNDGGGKTAMENEYLLATLLNRELDRGFLQNVMLKMIGDPDAPIAEHLQRFEEGKSYTKQSDALRNQLNQLSGMDGDTMMVFWSRIKEEFPDLQAFPSSFQYDKLKDVQEKVRIDIATATRVPLQLAGIQTGGAISKDDITTAVQLMYMIVRSFQHVISRTFNQILKNWHSEAIVSASTQIENYNPFPAQKIIEPYIWEVMTLEEKRKWIQENTDIELIENDGNTTN